jgi:uroporphyrinogen III methyltransferase/synthase
MRIASIGPITSNTVRDHGLKVDVEAHRHDIDGLVQAIRELFAEKNAAKSKL